MGRADNSRLPAAGVEPSAWLSFHLPVVCLDTHGFDLSLCEVGTIREHTSQEKRWVENALFELERWLRG